MHAVVAEVAADPFYYYYQPYDSGETADAPNNAAPNNVAPDAAGVGIAGGTEIHNRPHRPRRPRRPRAAQANINGVPRDDAHLATLRYQDGWLTCTNGQYELTIHLRTLLALGRVVFACILAACMYRFMVSSR